MKRVEDIFTPIEETKISVVFSAIFAGKFTDTIFADTGSVVNLIYSASIEIMLVSGAELQVGKLAKPAIYSLAVNEGEEDESLKIVCNTRAYCYEELHVRHGCTLMIRNVL